MMNSVLYPYFAGDAHIIRVLRGTYVDYKERKSKQRCLKKV